MSNIKFINRNMGTYVDNSFIDNYMADVPSPVFSLIYIYALRCANYGISISNGEIAKKFNILESDVVNCWKFWKEKNLLSLAGDKLNPIVELKEIKNESENEKNSFENKKSDKVEDKVKIITRHIYNPKEIGELSSQNKNIDEIIKYAESIKGSILSPKELEVIVWIANDLDFEQEALIVMLSYCLKGKKNHKYMEKMAIDWAEKGIVTMDMATEYINKQSRYNKVLKAFGVSDRKLSKGEIEIVDKWFDNYSISFELIDLAIQKTIEKTGKVAFSYCDKIIQNWVKSGFKSVKDVEENEAIYAKKGKSNVENITQKPKGTFNNYKQKIYSSEEIDEILKRKGNS